MEETLQQQTKKPSKAVFKAIIFAAFIIFYPQDYQKD
jgi:hypothetical protein